jgi:HD superfamily phosphodiesterase
VFANFLNPEDAERFACDAFAGQPARLSHILVVVDRAERTAREIAARHPGLCLDVPTVHCAALLHDIGYLDRAQRTGFHPVDGYHFLCDRGAEAVARRIVGHSSSPEEAGLRGIALPEPLDDLAARLVTYWDMQVKQGGEIVGYEERYRDILRRYGEGSVVGRAHRLARPRILGVLTHVDRLLTGLEEAADAAR